MRFYTIALYLFAFNLIIGVFNASGAFSKIQSYDMNITDTQKSFDYLGDSAAEIQSGTEFGDVLKMGGFFIDVVIKAVFVPGWYLGVMLNLTQLNPLVLLVDGCIWFVYLVGLVEFFSGRQVEPSG